MHCALSTSTMNGGGRKQGAGNKTQLTPCEQSAAAACKARDRFLSNPQFCTPTTRVAFYKRRLNRWQQRSLEQARQLQAPPLCKNVYFPRGVLSCLGSCLDTHLCLVLLFTSKHFQPRLRSRGSNPLASSHLHRRKPQPTITVYRLNSSSKHLKRLRTPHPTPTTVAKEPLKT